MTTMIIENTADTESATEEKIEALEEKIETLIETEANEAATTEQTNEENDKWQSLSMALDNVTAGQINQQSQITQMQEQLSAMHQSTQETLAALALMLTPSSVNQETESEEEDDRPNLEAEKPEPEKPEAESKKDFSRWL